jgi:hypothetical protein
LFKERGASGAKLEAEVDADVAALIGHSQHPPRLRRRGASGGA